MAATTGQNWQKLLQYNTVSVLLAAENQAISHFTRHVLLGEKVEPVHTVWELPQPQKILKKQQEDGSWTRAGKNKDIYPPNHYALVETFKNFRTLVEEYAFTKHHPAIPKAAEFLFTFQTKEGDIRGFIGNQYAPYYTGYVLSLLIKPDNYSAYHDPAYWTRFSSWWPNLLTALEILRPLRFPATDPEVKKALDWFIENQQPDSLWKIEQDKIVKDNPKEEQLWLSLRICRMLKKYWG